MDGAQQESADNRPTSRKEEKKALRRRALLDGAVQLFNAQGISGTNIADVAKQLGLARASLYHYVEDRSDLVFQCYQRSCDVTAQALDQADQADDGLAKILAYVRHALAPEQPPIAVLSEVSSLQGQRSKLIQKAKDANTDRLMQFVLSGIEDGSVRACDAEIVTQLIAGILAWSQLLPHWSKNQNIPLLRKRACDAMHLILDTGIARDQNFIFECGETIDSFFPRMENAFDRKQASALKVDLILARASKMFNQTGIESTSIDAVADSLGVTKGAMYHHFKDKNDLVARCYTRSFELYDQFYESSKGQGLTGLEASLTNSHLNIQAQVGPLSPLMPQPGFEALSAKRRSILKTKARQQNHAIADFLRIGQREGVVVPCEHGVVTHICAGAFGWIPKWLPNEREEQGIYIADTMCNLLATGLRNR